MAKYSGAFHKVKISGISCSEVNGTRFVGSSHWKIPRKSGKSKKVVPFSRLEFPNEMSCSIYVSRSLYQFQVHGRAPPRTKVYDQMEQLFTNQKFHFCYHRNLRVFFLNAKRPSSRPRIPRILHFAPACVQTTPPPLNKRSVFIAGGVCPSHFPPTCCIALTQGFSP